MNKWSKCVHNVAMVERCNRCPREYRLVLTINLITGEMSRWTFPHSLEQEQPSQTARAILAAESEAAR